MGDLISRLQGEGVVVAYFDFRQGTTDLSGNGHTLTTSGVAHNGEGYYFNGPGGTTTGDYIYTDAGAEFGPSSGTLTGWGVMHDRGQDFPTLCGLGYENNNRLLHNVWMASDTTRVYYEMGGPTVADVQGSATDSLNRFIVRTVTWDSSACTSYLDGVQDGTAAGDKTCSPSVPGNMRLRIGCDDKNKAAMFGMQYGAMLLSRALTATEVARLYGEIVK